MLPPQRPQGEADPEPAEHGLDRLMHLRKQGLIAFVQTVGLEGGERRVHGVEKLSKGAESADALANLSGTAAAT